MTWKRYFLPILFLATSTISAQTILQPGDLALLGIGANVRECRPEANDDIGGRDIVCFISFSDIETGTIIDITDNGWERANPGLWGNTEGFLRVTRTVRLYPQAR